MRKSKFFRMSGGDLFALVALLLYAIFAFVMIGSDLRISHIALFGWLMGGLMFFAPLVSLLSLKIEERKRKSNQS